MELQAGDQIGAYEIVSVLGRGGMATVYKAYHQRLDRHVAIKLMHTIFLQDDDFLARFRREARIVAKLEHPNIVPIYDSDEHRHTPYLVMKWIDGTTLKKHYLKQGMTLSDIQTTLHKIAQGLDYAHAKGVLHRDMKPSNVLLGENEQVYITDFGLARIVEVGSSTISHDMLLGTPYYISPEQAQGSDELDHRTDIYSLGVILYELLTGNVPFYADTPYAIIHGHIYTDAKPPSQINTQLSPAIDAVLERALAKNPQDRYPNAATLANAFAAACTPGIPERPFVAQSKPPQPTVSLASLTDTAESDAPRVENPIPSQQRRTTEFDLDMGAVNWSNIQQGIKTGIHSFAEMIEEGIDSELRQRRGIQLTDEELARRRVLKREKARQDFIGHLGSYITVNFVLVMVWLFVTGGFFWPVFSLFFWGLGLFSDGMNYYTRYGPGASHREARLQTEIERELARSQSSQKPKRQKTKRDNVDRLTTDYADGQAQEIRLTEDGELTDSFIREQGSKR